MSRKESVIPKAFSARGVVGPILSAFVALASGSAVLADTQPQAQTRVTIRGVGNNVTIERSQTSVTRKTVGPSASTRSSPHPLAHGAPPAGAVGEAVRLKSGGADDSVVLAYLRAHQRELPDVIDAQDVRELRKAGAGKIVLTALAGLTAVDLGETGEGHPSAESPPSLETGEEPYGSGYASPAIYGYAPPHGRRFMGHAFPARRMIPPHARPFPMGSPGRGVAGRRPLEP